MNQDENPCLGTVLLNCLEDPGKMVKILLGAVGFNIKDVDQQLDGAEDGLTIPLEVGFVEGILATAIPQVQDEIAKETDMMMLNVEGRGEAHGISSQIVGKDDASHRRFPAVGLAHQQNLLLGHLCRVLIRWCIRCGSAMLL